MGAIIVQSKPNIKSSKNYMGVNLNELYNNINKNTKVIFIANPNNPTGTIVSKQDIDVFMSKISKKIIIVLDEAYYEYAEHLGSKSCIDLLEKYPNMIITRSFSKIYALAGIRIGYGLASSGIISKLDKIRQPFNINYIAQEMAVASLSDSKFIKNSLLNNEKGMIFLKESFDNLGISYLNTYANFITIYLGTNTDRIYKKLLSKGIILRPLENYGLKSYLRVTIGTRLENLFFVNTLKNVIKGMSSNA